MQNIEQQTSRDWLVIMPRYISYSAFAILLPSFHITSLINMFIFTVRAGSNLGKNIHGRRGYNIFKSGFQCFK